MPNKLLVTQPYRYRLAWKGKYQDEWIGKNLIQLSLRQKHKLNVVALRRGGELTTDINPDMPFCSGDSVLVMIDKKYIGELLD